ncbi:unnamed protein product [Chrysodeixis includens]|uniref:Uncharacterized protein n=1 Tax=Chrysodeixis includens TaxID=689277 RepID=A0A9P0FSE5_CHRIL|nr:unnamed protein product [Chrysodeixis includens]
MHFYLVCNMNKIGRVFVVYILVVAATGAAEVKQKTVTTSKSESASKPKEQVSSAKHVSAHAVISHNDMMGVASIAAVDTRNGRVSSVSGVKVFPPMDSSMVKTDSKGNFIFKSVDGKMPAPITITKEGDGVKGTIRIAPGSVSVSSSANSGSASAISGHSSHSGHSGHSSHRFPDLAPLNPWPMPYMKPMMHDIFFPDPFFSFPSIPNTYHPRIPEPDFHRIQAPSFPRMPQPAFPRISQPTFSSMQDPWMDKDMFKHTLPMHNLLAPTWYYPNPFMNFW